MNLCFFYKFFSKIQKNASTRIDITIILLWARTSSENKKNAPWCGAFFLLSEEVLAYNGIIAISIRVEAFLVLFFWHFWKLLLNALYKHAW